MGQVFGARLMILGYYQAGAAGIEKGGCEFAN